MPQNVYTSVATVVGLILMCMAVLDWISYTDFLCSLIWR